MVFFGQNRFLYLLYRVIIIVDVQLFSQVIPTVLHKLLMLRLPLCLQHQERIDKTQIDATYTYNSTKHSKLFLHTKLLIYILHHTETHMDLRQEKFATLLTTSRTFQTVLKKLLVSSCFPIMVLESIRCRRPVLKMFQLQTLMLDIHLQLVELTSHLVFIHLTE